MNRDAEGPATDGTKGDAQEYVTLDPEEALRLEPFRFYVLTWLVSRWLLTLHPSNLETLFASFHKVRFQPDGLYERHTLDSTVRDLCDRIGQCPGVLSWLKDNEPAEPSEALVLPKVSRRCKFSTLQASVESVIAQASVHLRVVAEEPPFVFDPMVGGVLVGHLVRIFKLHETTCFLIDSGRLDTALIMWRSLIDTTISLGDILRSTDMSERGRRFIAQPKSREEDGIQPQETDGSARGLAEEIALQGRQKTLAYIAPEMARRRGQRRRAIRSEAESSEELLALYETLFVDLSSNVHGDWDDLRSQHILDAGVAFVPLLDYAGGGTGLKIVPTYIAVNAARSYCSWAFPQTGLARRLNDLTEWLDRAMKLPDTFEAHERQARRSEAATHITQRPWG